MEPVVTVHSFNEAYAELAAVSITSLVHNNPTRDCHAHIFENSVSNEALSKILTIGQKYPNARLTVHHIPDEAFAEIADGHYGKETWYPLLAPEMLRDCNKALVLEPDTLVCRDISELFDMDLRDSPMACHILNFSNMAPGKTKYFNAGVMLFNLGALRNADSFNARELTSVVLGMRARWPSNHLWVAQESYLNCVFDHDALCHIPFKYHMAGRMVTWCDPSIGFDEIFDGFSNPAIIHFVGPKPDRFGTHLPLLQKWWVCHALSPYANPQRDATRLQEIMEHRKQQRNSICTYTQYCDDYLLDDMLEAIDKLKCFSQNGMQIVFYGAGHWGTVFSRIARAMGLAPDKICDRGKCGTTIDGIAVESPNLLNGTTTTNTIVVMAIMEPRTLTNAKNAILGFGIPENHILPIFEQLALGGRRWDEILNSISQ